MAGYKYDWKCPNCGTQLQLKMRVTQTKRKCPHCGNPVTAEDIDFQAKWNKIGGLIGSFAIVGAILFCCKGCPSSTDQSRPKSVAPASSPTITQTPISTNPVADQPSTTSIPTATPSPNEVDLSTPQSAFESYLSAMWGHDLENYIKTLSKKRIRRELSDPILSRDGTGKKLGTLRDIISYQFRLRTLAPRTSSIEDYDLRSGYQLLGDAQIKGNSATVWYSNSGHWMVCRLTKEESAWKVDSHFDYPKKWEEEEFFREKRKKESANTSAK